MYLLSCKALLWSAYSQASAKPLSLPNLPLLTSNVLDALRSSLENTQSLSKTYLEVVWDVL